jgi:SAM-dependent methyltransferase
VNTHENNHQHHHDLKNPAMFAKVDDSPDEQFYIEPRLVVHTDDHFIETLSHFFSLHLPPQAQILDLMSSYKSHLPTDYKPAKVIGLGMNAPEMQTNSQLTEFVIHNLNINPILPFPDASFDVVLNTVSVQYMTHPVEVFREVGRVLKPDGLCIISFSNRMFATKAVYIWRALSEERRVDLVKQYLAEAGNFDLLEVTEDIDKRHHSGGILALLYNSKDPVYIIAARRKSN